MEGSLEKGTEIIKEGAVTLDTMGIAWHQHFKLRVLLHTRASTQEGVAMGSDPAQEIKSFSLAESLSAHPALHSKRTGGAS